MSDHTTDHAALARMRCRVQHGPRGSGWGPGGVVRLWSEAVEVHPIHRQAHLALVDLCDPTGAAGALRAVLTTCPRLATPAEALVLLDEVAACFAEFERDFARAIPASDG